MKEWLTVRNSIGAVLLGMFFITAGSSMGGGFGNAGGALISMVFLILAAILFSRSLSEFFSKPFTRIIDSIYFGSDDRDPPPVNLRLAVAYRLERRFEESIAECERQLEYHPRSAALWSEMICAAQEAGDRDLVEALQRRAARKLKSGDRLLLENGFYQV